MVVLMGMRKLNDPFRYQKRLFKGKFALIVRTFTYDVGRLAWSDPIQHHSGHSGLGIKKAV